MDGKLIYEVQTSVSQTIESGKALAQFLGMTEDLPEVISLAKNARLTLSSKKDIYYFTNAKTCTCPAGAYRPGTVCKHRKAILEAQKASSKLQAREYQACQRAIRSQRLQGAPEEPLIKHGGFRPVLE